VTSSRLLISRHEWVHNTPLKNECILVPRELRYFFTIHCFIFTPVFPPAHYTDNIVISERLHFYVKVALKFLSGTKTKFLFIIQSFNYKSLRKTDVTTELTRPTRFYKYVRRVIIWKPNTYLQLDTRNSSSGRSKLRLNKCLDTLTTPSHFTTSKFREGKVEYLGPMVWTGNVLSSLLRQEPGHPHWNFSWISWSLQVNTGIKPWNRLRQISFASILHHFYDDFITRQLIVLGTGCVSQQWRNNTTRPYATSLLRILNHAQLDTHTHTHTHTHTQ